MAVGVGEGEAVGEEARRARGEVGGEVVLPGDGCGAGGGDWEVVGDRDAGLAGKLAADGRRERDGFEGNVVRGTGGDGEVELDCGAGARDGEVVDGFGEVERGSAWRSGVGAAGECCQACGEERGG